jgi:RHS repeat-associated protein
VVTHLYDRYGRDTLMTDVNGTWQMRYDTARGALARLVTPFADSLLYTYDSWGRRNGPTVLSSSSSSLVASWDWSLAGQLQAATFYHGNYLLGGLTNVDTTDQSTNLRLAWGEQHGTGDTQRNSEDSLTNDGFERVLAAQYVRSGSLIATDTFSFDRDGGIIVAGEGRGYDVGTTRLTGRGAHSYQYDTAGNLVTDSVTNAVWKYGYDAMDRLVSARYNSTLIARYAYDVLGRRIVRRVYSAGPNSATVGYFRMVYGGGQVTAEADSSGSLTLGYVWGLGADDLVGVHDYASGSHYDLAQDGLHSVRGVARRDSTWQATYRYRAYGALLDSAGSVTFRLRYRWIGREFDEETGLYYVRARYYDPNSHRFTQEDPIGFAGGANVYAYGDGNPTNGRDLDGLSKDPDLTGRDPGDDWFRACMGTTGGCGGGGGWSRGAAWAGFSSFALLTNFEQDAEYEAYRTNAQARIGEAERLNDAARGGALKPFERSQFIAVYDALNAEIPADHSQKATILSNLGSGMFVLDSRSRFTASFNPYSLGGTSGEYFSAGPAGTLAAFSPRLFSPNVPRWFLAHAVVHEYRHNWGDRHGDEMCENIFSMVPVSRNQRRITNYGCK